jgi:hypothetical protein
LGALAVLASAVKAIEPNPEIDTAILDVNLGGDGLSRRRCACGAEYSLYL